MDKVFPDEYIEWVAKRTIKDIDELLEDLPDYVIERVKEKLKDLL